MIYLVDDDEAVRNALALLLATYGKEVATFPDAAHFLAHVDRDKPGILILDLRMPMVSGLQLMEQLAARGIDWPRIMITGHGDVAACRRAFRAGVTDFLTKPVDEYVLMDAVTLAESQLRDHFARDEARSLLGQLTSREAEVMELIAKGFGTKEIANALAVSVRTVDSHRASIATKLGTASIAEQTRLWIQIKG